jgi:hypothetical protein
VREDVVVVKAQGRRPVISGQRYCAAGHVMLNAPRSWPSSNPVAWSDG